MFWLESGQHLERQVRTGGDLEQLCRPHRAHQRAVLDGRNRFERNTPRALGQIGDLALPARRQIARRIGLARDGLGMTEQENAHAPQCAG